MFRVMGLDVSTSAVGIAIVDDMQVVECTTFKWSSDDWILRCNGHATMVLQAILDYKPHAIAIEAPYIMKNGKVASQLSIAWGFVARVCCQEGHIPMEIPPSEVKQIVTGKGNATKPQVAQACRTHFSLGDDYKFPTDDASDALGVAFAFIVLNGKGFK